MIDENVEASEITTQDVLKSLETQGSSSEFTNPVDDDFSSLVKDEFELEVNESFFGEQKPADKKEAYKRILTAIKEKAASAKVENDDPFIQDYLKAKEQQGFDIDSFVASKTMKKNLNQLENSDYLKVRLKAEKYSDEDIDTFIRSKNKIEIDKIANDYKREDEKLIDMSIANKINEQYTNLTKQNELQNSTIESTITKYYTDNYKKFPIKFADSEIEEIKKESVELLKMNVGKNKTNGQLVNYQKLDEVLANDDVMLQIMPFIVLAKNGKLESRLKDYISNVKSSEFDKIIDDDNIALGGNAKDDSKSIITKFFEQ